MLIMARNNVDPSHFEIHIDVSAAEQTALNLLAENTPLSKQKLKSAVSKGSLWLESSIGIHRLRRAKKILKPGDTLHFYYDQAILDSTPVAAELIADEAEYSIWNKPYGMYSQGSKWGDHCTITRWAEEYLKPQRPAFLVHRLDRAASGLIILAHSKKTAAAFSKLFKNRQIQKQYKATVEGNPGQLTLPYIISNDIEGKPAISMIIAIEPLVNNKTVITIEIETGRKHQIRKHLSASGYPIVGDRLYGSGKSKENLQLQSNYLKFNCPLTNTVREYSLKQTHKDKDKHE
jgi:tRNA pseudouridine32 synthase/23S rRNA pseudouridine746 synthase